MEYSVAAVIADKDLKKELSGSGYVLIDESGYFGENIDFSKQSMRQTHIETFVRLYSLGGDELFETIIAKGGTCLTKDRNAAKGMADIEGTDKYFLKANASALSAFSSILAGVMIWAEQEENVDETNDLKLTSDIEEEEEEFAEMEYTQVKHISIASKNGKSVLYDEDEDKFLSIEIEVDGKKETVSEFYSLEQMRFDYEFFDEKKEFVSGFKYQLSENGKFGYISQYFTQVTAPVYDEIIYSKTELFMPRVFAWYKTDGDEWDDDYIIHCAGYISVYDSEGNLLNEEVFPTDSNDKGFEIKVYNKDYLPQSSAFIEGLEKFGFNIDKNIIYYSPYNESQKAIVILPDEDFRRIEFSYSDGFITDGRTERPAQKLDVISCKNFLEDDKCEIKVEKFITKSFGSSVYVAKNKEGYYALCDIMANGRIESYNLITPFAFTDISILHVTENGEIYMLADQFGKKGVFTRVEFGNRAKYIIPCEYESIKVDFISTITLFEVVREDCFVVSKAGFEGKISLSGEWLEHLKRD